MSRQWRQAIAHTRHALPRACIRRVRSMAGWPRLRVRHNVPQLTIRINRMHHGPWTALIIGFKKYNADQAGRNASSGLPLTVIVCAAVRAGLAGTRTKSVSRQYICPTYIAAIILQRLASVHHQTPTANRQHAAGWPLYQQIILRLGAGSLGQRSARHSHATPMSTSNPANNECASRTPPINPPDFRDP